MTFQSISEVAIATFVVHLFTVDVGDVGSATLQVPRSLRFVGAGVTNDRPGAPVKVLRWGWQTWTTVRLIGTADLMNNDLLLRAIMLAVHFEEGIDFEIDFFCDWERF